ncbi:hypothetical protein [Moorena sp. SIO3H5]|nr:hypothetical protein [Moorena sp. SIO3H5]NEO69793.1 hypothetical protein [Moorena sp. SIO3H5]
MTLRVALYNSHQDDWGVSIDAIASWNAAWNLGRAREIISSLAVREIRK